MKKIALTLLLAVATVLVSAAQSDNGLSSTQRLIGHTTTDQIDAENACFGQAGTYTIGAVLTADALAPYAGCKVVGVRLAVGADLGRAKCHLQSVDGASTATAIVAQNQRLYKGWNNIFFNGNGYEIKSGENLFYGFDYTETAEMAAAQQGAICVVGENETNSFAFMQNSRIYPVSGGGKLCVALIIDASSLPAHDMAFTFFDTGFKYKKATEKFEVYAMLTATGRESVTSYRVGYRFDSLEPQYATVTKDIASSASDTWQTSIDMPASLAIGRHSFTAWVDAVEGEQLEQTAQRVASVDFAIYENTVARKKVYVENYVDTRAANAALFQEAMDAAATGDNAADMSVVNIFGPGSGLAVSKGAFLHDVNAYTLPSFTINRSYFPGEQHIAYDLNDYLASLPPVFIQGMLSDMIVQDLASASFATVAIDRVSYDATTHRVTATVSGNVLPEATAIYNDLAVTLMLVQDNATYNGQTYTNVLRTYLGDPLGNLVTPVGDTFSQQFSGTLPLGLDPEKMRLVAVIHKAHTEEAPTLTLDNARDYDIINCTDARLTGEGGVTDVTIDAADKQIEAIYTLQGTRVATDAPLAPGLYIIRYTDSTTAKRLIR